MNERRRHNDSSSEIPGEEIGVMGDLPSGNTFGNDWEEGEGSGNKENDKDGRDASTKVAVVVIFRDSQVAEYLLLAGRIEIHVGGIEGSHD